MEEHSSSRHRRRPWPSRAVCDGRNAESRHDWPSWVCMGPSWNFFKRCQRKDFLRAGASVHRKIIKSDNGDEAKIFY